MDFSKNTLNEIEQEMCSYLLNVDDMNYTILCDCMSELDMQRCSYLLNVDDMNYTMLCESSIIRHKSDIAPKMQNVWGLEKISLINELTRKEDNLEYMELIEAHGQMEFPKRKFHPLRPATMEDELAEDPSFSK